MEPLSWGTTHADLLTIHEILRDDGFLIKDFDRQSYMEVKKLTSLIIEPTNTCNLRCTFCFVTEGMTRDGGFMDFDLFKKIIEYFFSFLLVLTGIYLVI